MKAISVERAEFVDQRIKLLTAMHVELSSRPAKFVDASSKHALNLAISNIQAEKLQLLVELEVLNQVIENSKAQKSE